MLISSGSQRVNNRFKYYFSSIYIYIYIYIYISYKRLCSCENISNISNLLIMTT